MQGKGLIKFFTYVLLAVTAYQFLLMWPAWRVEGAAEEFAEEKSMSIQDEGLRKDERDKQLQYYLDSVSNEPVFSLLWLKNYTYQELKRQQVALGLDLRGGMSVVLQVDLEDLIVALSDQSADGTFRQALFNAKQAQRNSQRDFVSLFVAEYEKIAGGQKLASVFAAGERLKPRGIGLESSNADVAAAIRIEANETVERTYKLLKQRIDRFGVASPTVFLDNATDRITVELPGVTNPKRARTYLQATANLEFWEMYQNNEIVSALAELNESLRAAEKRAASKDTTNTATDTTATDTTNTTPTTSPDSTPTVSSDTSAVDSTDYGPLFKVLSPNAQGQVSPVVAFAKLADTPAVNRYLASAQAKKALPRNVKLLWDSKSFRSEESGERFIQLYAINTKGKKDAPLQGERITSAYATSSQKGSGYSVLLDMDEQGAQQWREMTRRNKGRPVAIVLDDKVYSSPNVENEIVGGGTEISGNFSVEEARDLANILSVGKLPTKTEIIEEAIVGPSLGQATVNAGLMALVAGFLLVLAFMLFYYSGAGLVSIACLLLNLLFIIGSLASFGTVLTLPGIAGIVLTIGMAVDANVIIFERIREEMRLGKTWAESVQSGFSASSSAIIDANFTTIAVATVLFLYGLGPIKGFATVLIVGVVSSVFTAVLVGRLFFQARLDKNQSLAMGTALTQNVLASPRVNFMGKRTIAYAFSGLLIVAGLASIFTRGFELGVDLQGGRSYTVEFPQDVNTEELKTKLTETFTAFAGDKATEYAADKVIVKTFNEANQAKITTSFMQTALVDNVDSVVLLRVYEGTKAYAGSNIEFDKFERGRPASDDQPGLYLSASNKVGPTIADDIQNSAYIASILAILVIFFYILIRFRRWQFSVAAIIALLHDTLIMLGVFSLLKGIMPFSMEIDQAYIAALLTIIGYSVNDTVIVFDRIRETLGTMKDAPFKEVVNTAINSTLSRTSITSLTTFIVIFILFIFGGDAIRGFAFALTIGIIFGTYSSIFVASPVVVDLTKDPEQLKWKEREKPVEPETVETTAEAGDDQEPPTA